MGIDLTKLTPLPLFAGFAGTTNLVLDNCVGTDSEGRVASFANPADAELHLLGRRALDVMMRRGVDWIWLERGDHGRIIADCPSYGWIPGQWDDPYTAWVEADAWMTAQEQADAAS